MDALATISQLPETRAEQKSFVDACVEEIVNGNNDPARVYVKLRIIGDAIKDILDSPIVKRVAVGEVRKYNGDCEINGNKITISSRATWDFSGCNYKNWNDAKIDEANAKDRIKHAESFLKTLTMCLADPETGELINPPTASSTEFIVVK